MSDQGTTYDTPGGCLCIVDHGSNIDCPHHGAVAMGYLPPAVAKEIAKRMEVSSHFVARVTHLLFVATVCWVLSHAALMVLQDSLDKNREQRNQQTLQQLQKLFQGNSSQIQAAPEDQSAPDPGQLDYRLERNSDHSHTTRGAMRVYLSARFQRQEEMRRYAEQLRAEAIEVVSAWHDIDSPSSDGFSGLDDQRRAWLAMLDVQQLSGTNVVTVFSEDAKPVRRQHSRDRAVRHVEFGTALALGKRVLLVGDAENSFYCLPDVEHFPSWPDALMRILELRGSDAMTTREAAREANTTVQQLGAWIREGRLPAAKHNGHYVIGRNDLDRAKAQHLRARADALTAMNSERLFPKKG